MDEISKAAMKRFKAAFADAGLNLRTQPGQVDSPAVRLWLYSCQFDPKAGFRVRLVSQVSADTYRRMQGRGQLEMLVPDKSGIKKLSAGDALMAGIEAYDESVMAGVACEGQRQMVSLLMCRYVCSTKTWAMAPSLDSVDGIHIALIDWHSKSRQVLRPAMLMRKGVLGEDDVAGLCAAALRQHFSLHPEDMP